MTTRDSDDESLRQSIVALIPRLRRFGYSLTGSMEDGDDIAQIALERAISRLDQWTRGTRLDSWLFRIAHNAWIDEVRSRRRRGDALPLEAAADVSPEDGRRSDHFRLELAAVRKAVATLPEDQRAVLVLIAIEGLSYRETADILGVPIGTVMSRLSRARRVVQDMVRGYTPASGES